MMKWKNNDEMEKRQWNYTDYYDHEAIRLRGQKR